MTDRERAERSLFWHGDLRECPDLEGTSVAEEAKESIRYWHGEDAVKKEWWEE